MGIRFSQFGKFRKWLILQRSLLVFNIHLCKFRNRFRLEYCCYLLLEHFCRICRMGYGFRSLNWTYWSINDVPRNVPNILSGRRWKSNFSISSRWTFRNLISYFRLHDLLRIQLAQNSYRCARCFSWLPCRNQKNLFGANFLFLYLNDFYLPFHYRFDVNQSYRRNHTGKWLLIKEY